VKTQKAAQKAHVAMSALDEIMAIVYYHVPPEHWDTIEDRASSVRAVLSGAGDLERALESALARERALREEILGLEQRINAALAALMPGRGRGR